MGSDLDVLVAAPDGDLAGDNSRATAWQQWLRPRHTLGAAFELDLRLRPHGRDGPMVTTLSALRALSLIHI